MEVIVPTQSKDSVSEGEPTGGIIAPPPSADKDRKIVQDRDVTLKLELELLQERLHQRDGEIGILLRMLKQERKRADRAEASLAATGAIVRSISPASPDRLSPVRLARIAMPENASSSTNAATVWDGKPSPRGVEVGVKMGGGGVRSDGGRDGGAMRKGLADTEGSSVTGSAPYSSSHDSEEWRAVLKEGESNFCGRSRQDFFCVIYV